MQIEIFSQEGFGSDKAVITEMIRHLAPDAKVEFHKDFNVERSTLVMVGGNEQTFDNLSKVLKFYDIFKA